MNLITPKNIFIAVILCTTSYCAMAQDDSLDAHQASVDRYFKVVPMAKQLEDSYAMAAKMLPPEQRANFIEHMRKNVRVFTLERNAKEVVAKVFTTEELNAISNFQESKNGSSATRKLGIYMEQMMPAMQHEMQRASQQSQSQ